MPTKPALGARYDSTQQTLEADTTYWLSIVNNTVGTSNTWAWGIESFATGNALSRSTDGDNWSTDPFNLAFRLTGPAIPEPTAALLFGSGFAVVGLAARRRSAS